MRINAKWPCREIRLIIVRGNEINLADGCSLTEGDGIFASAANIPEVANILFPASRCCGKFFRGFGERCACALLKETERKRERKNVPRRLGRSAGSLVRNHESFISFGDKKRVWERDRERGREGKGSRLRNPFGWILVWVWTNFLIDQTSESVIVLSKNVSGQLNNLFATRISFHSIEWVSLCTYFVLWTDSSRAQN